MKIYLCLTCFFLITQTRLTAQTTPPHIIFVTFDDLNDYVEGFDGSLQVETPALQNLAVSSTLFYNAYCAAPQCGPSRAAMLSGKDLFYTQVYNNPSHKCRDFRKNFTAEQNNEEVVTLPEYLKDSAGYFTYSLNKIFHCYENAIDFDSTTSEMCDKKLSWNKIFLYNDSVIIDSAGIANLEGPTTFTWALLEDSLETELEDYIMIDSAIAFIKQYAENPSVACNKPLFLGLGFRKPHLPYYIPKKYYSSMYEKLYAQPYDMPFNYPENSFPVNGLIMPPQPIPPYSDFDHLPPQGVAVSLADAGLENTFNKFVEQLNPPPPLDAQYDDDFRTFVLQQSIRANAILGYMAAIKFADAQLGRFLDSLKTHPEIYNNCIIIVLGDHGFSLGEKKHWRKSSLWETDIRAPLIYADMRNTQAAVTERQVSFLDIFPTLCDVVGIPYPKFSDGSEYLDGHSFLPLLKNADTVTEHPMLTAYIEKSPTDQGGCFPQYSVRSDRFHYITYQTNNEYGVFECDFSKSIREEEFYDVGIHRQTDPYEWNNLMQNPDYAPAVKYLQQWLPDSALYLQKTYKAILKNDSLPCYLEEDDTLSLSFDLYHEDGTYFTVKPAALTYRWLTNVTNDTLYAENFSLNMADIPDVNTVDKCIVYLEVVDSNNVIAGFDMKQFYIHGENTPQVTFLATAVGETVYIQNYSVNGEITNSWWDFGEGEIVKGNVPGPYTYASPGTYTIQHFVEYGNGCIEKFTSVITTGKLQSSGKCDMKIFPNPAMNTLGLVIDNSLGDGNLLITDMLGNTVLTEEINIASQDAIHFTDISFLSKGPYIARFVATETQCGIFIKQ